MMLELVTTSGQRIRRRPHFTFTRTTPGVVEWSTHLTFSQASRRVKGRMEIRRIAELRALGAATGAMELSDVRLVTARSRVVLPDRPAAGGRRGATFDWKWDVANKHQDSVWLGAVNGGLYIVLKAENYVRPGVNIHYTRRPLNDPPSWSGGGKGNLDLGGQPAGASAGRASKRASRCISTPGDALSSAARRSSGATGISIRVASRTITPSIWRTRRRPPPTSSTCTRATGSIHTSTIRS